MHACIQKRRREEREGYRGIGAGMCIFAGWHECRRLGVHAVEAGKRRRCIYRVGLLKCQLSPSNAQKDQQNTKKSHTRCGSPHLSHAGSGWTVLRGHKKVAGSQPQYSFGCALSGGCEWLSDPWVTPQHVVQNGGGHSVHWTCSQRRAADRLRVERVGGATLVVDLVAKRAKDCSAAGALRTAHSAEV